MKHRKLSRQDVADEQWEAMYKELVAYCKNYGDCNVPSTLKSRLSYWVTSQRESYRENKSRMTPFRVAQLNKLGFIWGSTTRTSAAAQISSTKNDQRWQEMYDQLKAYKLENGDCKVPLREYMAKSNWGPLGRWVSRQRLARDTMSLERKALLDDIGFLWVADNWDTMYDKLVEYHDEHGHSHVKQGSSLKHKSLSAWCQKQKTCMRQNSLQSDRRALLLRIDFDFEPQSVKNERAWNSMFQRLKKYKMQHGNCSVPRKEPQSTDLANWAVRMRAHYKNGKLSVDRTQKLDEIGFVWSGVLKRTSTLEKNEAQWERKFETLKESFEKNGHFSVPSLTDEGTPNPLAAWVTTQRTAYRQSRLRKDRKLKLDSIAFVWQEGAAHRSDRLWKIAFEKLVQFRSERGHTYVLHSDDLTLWRFTERMMWKFKAGTLSPAREEQLRSIGFFEAPPLVGFVVDEEAAGEISKFDDNGVAEDPPSLDHLLSTFSEC